MRVEVGIPGGARSQTPAARQFRESIIAAFAAEGQTVDVWSDFVQRGEVEDAITLFVVIACHGMIWDAEKAAAHRALSALRRVMADDDRIGAITSIERPDRQPVEYWIPSGPEGDRAFDALETDYATDPASGQRDWWPGIGWMATREMVDRMEAGESVPPKAPKKPKPRKGAPMTEYTCTGCGRPIQADQEIRIGCRLERVHTQTGPAYVVTHPTQIYLFHQEHAPAGGYEFSAAMSLAAAFREGLILG